MPSSTRAGASEPKGAGAHVPPDEEVFVTEGVPSIDDLCGPGEADLVPRQDDAFRERHAPTGPEIVATIARGGTARELRRLGVRVAGFSVRDLLNFGHNENHVVTAGYSIRDLVHEGLSTRVVDREGFRNA
jgi:hypothetical protein